MLISECCGYPMTSLDGDGKDAIGLCSRCGEWADVVSEEEGEENVSS